MLGSLLLDLLPVPSDRSRQTIRLENDLSVEGSVSLATVDSTPFSVVYKALLNVLFLHDFNVVLAGDYVVEGVQ